jgi:hypothetical protein
VPFGEFEVRLPEALTDRGLLSLLVGATMETGVGPFEKYFDLLLR